MRMIKIATLPNGAHNNQTYHNTLPEGWALIPDGMICENFPFGSFEVTDIDGFMTVTKWTPGTMPESNVAEESLSQLDKIEAQVIYTAMMTDTLLEV